MSSRDPLSETLQRWQHEPVPDPHFQPEVWARIHATKSTSDSSAVFYRWALPIAASIALAAGIGSAMHTARRQHTEQMARAYVRSIDPLQMHAAAIRP